MEHLIDFNDMPLSEWDAMYSLFRDILHRPGDYADALRGKLIANLFFEPSTRTSFSFQGAMLRLGGGVFGFSDPGASSVSKGERLKDTVMMCSSYADLLVMRNPKEGAAKAASLYAACPVINAGDGGHLHPTQTLTDLATILQLRGRLTGLNIGLCGDLKNGRTIHSLIKALSRYEGNRFYLISPRELEMPAYIRDFLKQKEQAYVEVLGLEPTMPQLDVLYMTRIQRERFDDPAAYERLKNVYTLNAQKMKLGRNDLIVMHPLPRVDEIHMDMDGDPRAAYFKQARYGMFVRMALLLTLSKRGWSEPEFLPPNRSGHACDNPNCITGYEAYLPERRREEGGRVYCGYCDKEISAFPEETSDKTGI
ncbi:aspartate carbamoyltransferase [Oscillospiraceae bacterium OttesenSCG-928-G22]|nr:aspartate carbamoyltransferase [Oscillospiraceae bacterium OttesenSCG-928-G22]